MTGATSPFPVEVSQTTPHGLRIDIQLLRALAVLLVVVQHAGFPYIPGGFLGVDIFFVVSGYLMTGIISRELDEGRFGFGRFYARRARRLLPAAFSTFAVTALLAPFVLDRAEYRDFVLQLAGSIGFVANIVLWMQSSYFSTGAALKPLLHIWSLGVEEQFYILFPLFLVLCPRRLRLPATIVLVAISLGLCLAFLQRSPSMVFYALPTRAWELGIGAAVALLVRAGVLRERRMLPLRLFAAGVLGIVPLFATDGGHPGLAALAVCLATALLVVPGLDIAPARWLAPFVAVGNRSYSLYLVHWPLLAFANNLYIGAVPAEIRAVAVAIALIWMELQYRFIEQPCRTMTINWRSVTAFVVAGSAMIGASAGALTMMPDKAGTAREPNTGLAPSCVFKDSFVLQPECRSAENPHSLLWGDSIAMALAPGLAATSGDGILQATKPVCGPFLGLAPVNDGAYNASWAKGCIAFNDSVLAELARSPHIDTVVLSSVLAQYVPRVEDFRMMVRGPKGTAIVPQNEEQLILALGRTAEAVRKLGKRVVFVGPPPTVGLDIGRCQTRAVEGKPTVFPPEGCGFSNASYRAYRAPILASLDRFRDNGVPVIMLNPALCDDAGCRVQEGSVILYRDEAHLSKAGSIAVARALQLGTRAREVAR